MQNSRLLFFVFSLVFCQLFCFSTSATVEAQQNRQPNIILLNLDDADSDILSAENIDRHFPAMAQLFRRATVFTNAHCTTPFCAPSRAALMTGKYGFNNGCRTGSEKVASSAGFQGGYQRFKSFNHHENELGVWMKKAGYRTIHVGKYHHDGFDFEVPVGWDDFSADLGARYYGMSRFSNVDRDRAGKRYRLGDDDYTTTEERREALRALDIHTQQRPNQPYFLYLAPIAPHSPVGPDLSRMAEPKYRYYAQGLKLPTDAPDFDEADLSDKASFLQRQPLLESEKQSLQTSFIYRLRSMKSVDDMIGALVNRLKQNGTWDNTYFLLTSDNGYSLGHHRLKFKKDPYERSSRVPLFAVSPESRSRRIASHLIAHIDICPTILELAGGNLARGFDGKSFAQLIDNPHSANPLTWQRSVMIENWTEKGVLGNFIPMSYTAERFYNKVHIAWSNGDHEYYLLDNDPYQLNSVYDELNDQQKNFLNRSLLRFRKRDVAPEITLTSPEHGTPVNRRIKFSGYMDDNSVPVMARLAVRSVTTNRYFNGNRWQENYASIAVPADSLTSSINSWSYDLDIFSETPNNYDLLVSWVVPVDDSMRQGPLKFTVNALENNSIFAQINPTIDGKTFTGSTQRIVGFHGRYPNQKVDFFIVDTDTFEFFNGQTMQPNFVALTARNLPNSRWSSQTLRLPPGDYRCYAQAYFEDLYQGEASIAEFSVK